jgi:MFS family permease
MTTAAQPAFNPYGLIRAADAVTDWRALATTALAALAFFLCAALSGWMAKTSGALAALFGLLTLVVGMVGYSSIGIMLMRRAQGVETSIADAVMQAVFTVHRLLGVALLMLLAVVGVALAALLLLFVCKLPGVGNVLYAIVFPIVTVAMGMTIAGMFYVAFPLAAPAVWAGNTIWQTAARLFVIIRQRLLSVITNLVILSILVFFLSSVVMFVLYSGYFATVGLSAKVGINALGGLGGLFQGAMGGMGGMGGMSGYGQDEGAMSYGGALAFASGLVFMVGMIIPFLTFINGSCLIYLQTVDGLEFDGAEQQLRGHMDEAKRRAQEARERAGAKLEEAKAAAQRHAPAASPAAAAAAAAAPAAAAAAPAPARSCASCHEALAADDVFCGGCGTKNPL